MKNKALAFDDTLITPQFSHIKSRKDVDTSVNFLGLNLKLGVISSNMDTVTESHMAREMRNLGALGALHRFMSIEDNVKMFLESPKETIVSLGLGPEEVKRAEALYNAGATNFLIDVAHGASIEVVNQVKTIRNVLGNEIKLIVGNFATKDTIKVFKSYLGDYRVDAWKIGIGGGSACLTRKVTGCGLPTLASIQDCASVDEPIIADGGIRNSGDFAKALAAGATVVMLGGMLAGSDESPGQVYDDLGSVTIGKREGRSGDLVKKYRGSASQESYEVQGKTSEWRTAEGDSFLIPYTGPVKNTLQTLEAGLRSAMTYVGASNLLEFRENVEFVQVTPAGVLESGAHGKG